MRAFCNRRPELALLLTIMGLMTIRLGLYAGVTGGWANMPSALCHYDCEWYDRLAVMGYDAEPLAAPASGYSQANWAFMPVFPGLIRVVLVLLHVPARAAGLIIANLCLAFFAWVAAKYWRLLRGPRSGLGLVVFLFAFPYGFYESLGYTESLFAALAMLALYLLARGQNLAACAVAAVLSATRVTGVLLAVIIAARILAPAAKAVWHGEWRTARGLALDAALPVALAPLGLFLFMAYLYIKTGDGLAFEHIQTAWHRHPGFPLARLARGLWPLDLQYLFSRTTQSSNFAAICGLAGMALALRLWLMRRYPEALFLLASILLPLSTGLTSLSRYVLANPVFEVFLFDVVSGWYSRRLALPLVVAFAAFQLYLVHLWTESYASLF